MTSLVPLVSVLRARTHLEVGDGTPSACQAVSDALHRLNEARPCGLHILLEVVKIAVELLEDLFHAGLHVLRLDRVPQRERVILRSRSSVRILRVVRRSGC